MKSGTFTSLALASFVAITGKASADLATLSPDAIAGPAPQGNGEVVAGIESFGLGNLKSPSSISFGGTVTSGQYLAYAVINGQVRFAAPEPGDLPIAITGSLEIDPGTGTAQFEFGGTKSTPTRSFTFDIAVSNIINGVRVTDQEIIVEDVFDGFDFSLAIDRSSGTGVFDYSESVIAGGVAIDRRASGVISPTTVIPTPATLAVFGGLWGVASSRRR